MDVLKLTHKNKEFEVIVRSDDITYSWDRFRSQTRLKESVHGEDGSCPYAERYCKYTASESCLLDLYRYGGLTNTLDSQTSATLWDEKWPVMFETCEYNIAIRFNKGILDSGTKPRVLHVRNDVERSFFIDKDYEGNIIGLSGNVSFLNEPGTFKLEFEYVHGGRIHDVWMTFEVVCPKLDTKNDYKSLLHDVNDEYNNVIFRYLATTYQQLARGYVRNDVVWMNIFESIVADYLKNVEMIIRKPHQRVQSYTEYAHADRIRRWTPELEDEYRDVEKQKRLENHYFGYKEKTTSVNTRENRFVKHTLETIGRRLTHILDEVLTKHRNEELSDNHRKDLVAYRDRIKKLERHPFFRTVGKFEGMSQDSMVLQSRMGYQQVYKDWIKLRRGIDLYNGASNIGTLQIWEIYELWCFIKMKRMVKRLLHIDDEHPYYEKLVSEPKGSLLNPFTNSTMEHIVKFEYPEPEENDDSEWAKQMRAHKGDVISLHYQHTFNRRNNDDFGVHTATTEQRPDVVLNIEKKDGSEILLTYLYDAKYRVVSDKKLDKDIESADLSELEELKGGDYPPSSAINQMHRYRDAIYYGQNKSDQSSKEIIGGYILFPGRGDADTIAQKRYYSNSVKSVNIGAFPLLPDADKDKEGLLLYEHLKDILLNKSVGSEHVAKAVPQRGLQYTDDPELSMARKWKREKVLIVVDDNKQHQEQFPIFNRWGIGLEMTPQAFEIVKEFGKAKYFILTNKKEATLYRISAEPYVMMEGAKSIAVCRKYDYAKSGKEPDFHLIIPVKSGALDTPSIDIEKVKATVEGGKTSYDPRIVKMEDVIKTE